MSKVLSFDDPLSRLIIAVIPTSTWNQLLRSQGKLTFVAVSEPSTEDEDRGCVDFASGTLVDIADLAQKNGPVSVSLFALADSRRGEKLGEMTLHLRWDGPEIAERSDSLYEDRDRQDFQSVEDSMRSVFRGDASLPISSSFARLPPVVAAANSSDRAATVSPSQDTATQELDQVIGSNLDREDSPQDSLDELVEKVFQ